MVPKERAKRITDRWRIDLALSPPELENFRWNLITEELANNFTEEPDDEDDDI